MNKNQIAIITPARFPGTAGDTANYSEIIDVLLRKGFGVLLICPKSEFTKENQMQALGNFEIIRIPCRPPRLEQIKNKSGINHYLRLFLFLILESLVVFWILKSRRIKRVYMRHSVLTMQLPFLLKLLRVKTIADGELISDLLKERLNPRFFRFLSSFEKTIMNFYSYYKVSTNVQAENLQYLGFFPQEKILIIPVSINIEAIPKFSIEKIPPHTFGYFGILEQGQGVDMLLQAFQLLLRKVPTAVLYIIGNGSMKNDLKANVLQNNLSSHVIFVDGIPREMLWHNYFNKFRVVIVPRIRQNNSIDWNPSIKLVESLAAGKPIIATDIPAFKEIPKSPLLLIPSANPVLLSEAMESLSNNESKLKEYSQASLACAVNYDITLNISKLTAIFADQVG
jgi:glycosyltransferase involved in cell wall biosynthesis